MITSWSPSRLEKYESCPARCKYEVIDKLCPACFNGKLIGWETPTCDHCNKVQEQAAPLKRGSEIHEELEMTVTGRRGRVGNGFTAMKELLTTLRGAYKRGQVRVEQDIVLSRKWEPLSKFDKGAWIRTKIDVLYMKNDTEAVVIDWKTGGIDKDSGKPKAEAKYDDQLEVYALVVLAQYPQVEVVQPKLIFVDAKSDHEVTRKPVRRADEAKLRGVWERRTKALLADKRFAPRPGYACRWCPFTRNAGGPCKF